MNTNNNSQGCVDCTSTSQIIPCINCSDDSNKCGFKMDAECVFYNYNKQSEPSLLINIGYPSNTNLKVILQKIDELLGSSATSTLASNGLNKSVNTIKLGGTLTENTNLLLNSFNLSLDGSNIRFNSFTNTRDDSGSITPINFFYTDATGFIKSSPLSYILNQLTSETSLTATDSSSINFTTSGTSNHTLTGNVVLASSSPFNTTSGLNLDVENGLNISSNKVRLGGALTADTTFTGNYKMFLSGGPKLHIGLDTTTHSSDSLLSIISNYATLPIAPAARYLLNVRSSEANYKNYFSISENTTDTFRINIGWAGNGASASDAGGALTITKKDISGQSNGISFPYTTGLHFSRNKPIIFSGFGYPSSPEVPISFDTQGETVRQRYDSGFISPTIGTNQEIGSSFRVHCQQSHITSLHEKYEIVGAKISSNNGAFGSYADTHRNVNLSVEIANVLQNTVNLQVTGQAIYNDNLGNTNPNKYTSVLIGSVISRTTDEDGDPTQNKIMSVVGIHLADYFGQSAGYNIIGYHYDPIWTGGAPAQSARNESAIVTERGKVLFKNADNNSYVQFPNHTESTRDSMSSGWGISQKGAQIFVTDGSNANTMQYWNGTIWIVM